MTVTVSYAYTDKFHPKIEPQIMHSGSKLFRCSIRCQLDAWSGLNRLKQVETGSEEGREEGSKQVDVCIVSRIRVDGKRSAIWQLTGPENAKYYLVDSNSVLCEADSWQIAS